MDIGDKEALAPNMRKYENYRAQMGRLQRALTQEFWLEAIFIEYAVMEDRLESALRHAGVWKEPEPGQPYPSLHKKLSKLLKLMENKQGLERRYFTEALMTDISAWKDKRNRLIHQMMNSRVSREELQTIALQGRELIRLLSNQLSNYKRALARRDKKNNPLAPAKADDPALNGAQPS